MAGDSDRKRIVAASFDEHATGYLGSKVHREGDDLELLAAWCSGANRALDVATGAGHTAGAVLARGVPTVVAADAAPTMIRTAAEACPGVVGIVSDAENLPFEPGTFGAVTCRIAAHHFPAPRAFLEEVARVLEPEGVLAFEDNVAPEDPDLDAFLNRLERLRDPTHGRSHRISEWQRMIEDAGLTVEETRTLEKPIDVADWIDQLDPPSGRRHRVRELLTDPPANAVEVFEITRGGGRVDSFASPKVLIRARR